MNDLEDYFQCLPFEIFRLYYQPFFLLLFCQVFKLQSILPYSSTPSLTFSASLLFSHLIDDLLLVQIAYFFVGEENFLIM